jgi:hypothetical protein
MPLDPKSRALVVLKTHGRGKNYDDAVRLYLLSDPKRKSVTVDHAEIAAVQRRLELEAGL